MMQRENIPRIGALLVSLGILMGVAPTEAVAPPNAGVIHFLKEMMQSNVAHVKTFQTRIDQKALLHQTPRATVLMCSDSRIDLDALDDMPAGDVFVIRNIGNQMETALGSVEYGVNHLHTPLLLIVGHSECGAVKAGMGDISQIPEPVRSELQTLPASGHATTLTQAAIQNIQHQVDDAVARFATRIQSGELMVVGLFYDLHDVFKQGHGRLVVVNINAVSEPKALAALPVIAALKGAYVLPAA